MVDDHSDVVLSKNNITEIAHSEGVGRITDGAKVHISNEMELVIRNILNQARTVARHSGRKMVKEEDVRLVLSLQRKDVFQND